MLNDNEWLIYTNEVNDNYLFEMRNVRAIYGCSQIE